MATSRGPRCRLLSIRSLRLSCVAGVHEPWPRAMAHAAGYCSFNLLRFPAWPGSVAHGHDPWPALQ
eukprot:5862606-Alexandrium_andersonii.AAC.1